MEKLIRVHETDTRAFYSRHRGHAFAKIGERVANEVARPPKAHPDPVTIENGSGLSNLIG